LEAGRWTVPLGQPRLPQILVVVTRSVAVDRAFGRHELRRPTLFTDQVPLPVELSLWSIGRPTGAAPPDVEGAMTVAAAEHSVLRLDRSISIVEAATPTATALPKPESGGWFRFWAAHFSAMRQPAAAASTPSNVGQELSLVPATAEERQAEVWNRIDAWTQLSGESESAGESDQLQNGPDKAADRPTDPLRLIAALPPRLADSNYKWTYCVADGAADQLTVGRLRASASFGRGRAIGLLTIVGLTALSFWFVRQPRKRGNPLLEESDGPPLAE
jgi:hypothetical protein